MSDMLWKKINLTFGIHASVWPNDMRAYNWSKNAVWYFEKRNYMQITEEYRA